MEHRKEDKAPTDASNLKPPDHQVPQVKINGSDKGFTSRLPNYTERLTIGFEPASQQNNKLTACLPATSRESPPGLHRPGNEKNFFNPAPKLRLGAIARYRGGTGQAKKKHVT